tara:strand:+ start:2132 stop:2986 length:855 start_codon:yes stop_codon:yes gene_type:complete
MTENTNPLNKYFRQPSIYVTLPSGASYPPTVLQQTQSGEIGIQPMTAKDEIRFKTPDALMNGQGVVDVIESCVPQIKDAWQIKSYDLDTLLIAIRIATYGETMDFTFTVPGANEQVTHSQNLPAILDQIKSTTIQSDITLEDGLKISVRPLTYKDMTTASQQTFQQQKMYSAVQDSELPDEDKSKRFNESFKALTDLNTSILLKNISAITMQDGTQVTDPAQIKEFMDNANAKLIKEIENKMIALRSQGAVKPLKLKATEEQIKKGAPATYEVPITFDTANFFV